MPVFQSSGDNREIVEEIMSHLKILDKKEEALCYFALFIPLPMKNILTQTIAKTIGGLGDFFPIGILGKDGKFIAKSRPIKKGANDIDEHDIREIVEESIIVPSDRKESYIKGLMSDFSGDFMTALYILIPQVEN